MICFFSYWWLYVFTWLCWLKQGPLKKQWQSAADICKHKLTNKIHVARQPLTMIIDTVSHEHGRHVTTQAWTVSHINAHIRQRSWLLCILLPSSTCLISKLQFFACMLHSRPSERGMCPVEMSVMRQWWQTSSRTWVPLQWSQMADSPSLLPQPTLCDWSNQLDNAVTRLPHKKRRKPERDIFSIMLLYDAHWGLILSFEVCWVAKTSPDT